MSYTKTGRFSKEEDDFIRANYESMTDKAIAASLKRTRKSIINRRHKMGFVQETTKGKARITEKNRDAYMATLDEHDRSGVYEKEVRNSSRFKNIFLAYDHIELNYYVEKYVEFMMDPTIETMTAMEKDTLHQMIISEIRINRYSRQEKEDEKQAKEDGRSPISRAREINECQQIIKKCQESLNVERKQRLKNQSDQSITFTNLIRELKDPSARLRTGREAAMLKFICEMYYNDNVGKSIISGKDHGCLLYTSPSPRD